MKVLATRQVEKGLKVLGFNRKPGKGRGDGHEDWVNSRGNRVNPPLRKKDLHIRTLYCLMEALEAQGICGRRKFLEICRAA